MIVHYAPQARYHAVQMACTGKWSLIAPFNGHNTGISMIVGGEYYTFERDKVTCPACRETLE